MKAPNTRSIRAWTLGLLAVACTAQVDDGGPFATVGMTGPTSGGTAGTAGDGTAGPTGTGDVDDTGPLDGSSGDATTEPGDATDGACDPPCDPLTTVCEAGQCVPPGPPSSGQVVITELMPNPALATDDDGEWIELTNVGPDPVDLEGCVLYDDANDEDVIDPGAPLVVPPGGQAVLAKVADIALNGGVPGVAYAFGTSYTLANLGDEVRLECGGTVIDRVVYLDTWPFDDGVAMQLSSAALDATANDDPSGWCLATTPYGSGDLGTPGQANAGC